MIAANDVRPQFSQDLGNNESQSRGLFPQANGSFLVMTFSESKHLKTKSGAIKWLNKRGYNEMGDSLT